MCHISVEIFQKHTRRNSNLMKKSLPPSRPKSTLKQHISIYIDKKLAIYIYIYIEESRLTYYNGMR
jgi:hypothetical protein